MRVGIALEETWAFLHEIYQELQAHHQTSLFHRREIRTPFFYERFNRYFFHHDLRMFMRNNDVVFFEWASGLLAAATNGPKLSPIVTRLHRYEMYQWVDHINWDNVDTIILVSEAKKTEFLERFPAQRDKVEVVYEGVDPEKFQFRPKLFSGDIGILCHLTPRKRVYELLLAFYELWRHAPYLHLHIGGGPHHKHLDYYYAIHDLVKKLNLEAGVTFYGHVQTPVQWYDNVDIFVSNAYSEGLQVAPMEAMASGCYTLSHQWAGAEEILPEANLFYSDKELRERILRYCDLPEREKSHQRAHMRSIVCDNFNVHKTKLRVRELVEEATE